MKKLVCNGIKGWPLTLWVLFFTLVGVQRSALMQSQTCPALMETALHLTHQVCQTTEANQACYGHARIEAQPQPDVGSLNFARTGDKIELTSLRTLRLSTLDPLNRLWGVALMNVRANLPGAPLAQPVTFLLFGDVEIENRVEIPVEVPVTVVSRQNLNLRLLPSLNATVLGTFVNGATVTARGRLADSSWLYVEQPETGRIGWVVASAMSGNIAQLKVVEPSSAYFGPMQAFYLQTGSDEACAEVPETGLIIQTPEGAAEVSLWINEVRVRLGSTAFIQARPNGEMTIAMLTGHAVVEAFDSTQTALAGDQISVPLNEQGVASAPPDPPQPIQLGEVQALPLDLLEGEVTLSTPMVPTLASATTVLPTTTPTTSPTEPLHTPFPTATTPPPSATSCGVPSGLGNPDPVCPP